MYGKSNPVTTDEYIITVYGDAEFCVSYLTPFDARESHHYCRLFERATMELGEAWEVFADWYKDTDASDPIRERPLSIYAREFYIDRVQCAAITLHN